jgi:hypothetical protein
MYFLGGITLSIKNLDRQAQVEAEMKTNLLSALNSGNEDEMAVALTAFASTIQTNILSEAKRTMNEDLTDRQVLANRGLQVLTKDELTYYNQVIAAQGFDGVEQLVPATVIDRVFEYLTANHALLKHIQFVNTTGTTEWVTKKGDIKTAFWGKLTSDIKELLDDGFEKLATGLYKLSAFIPVAKSMLDLGPVWLDKYVRTILAESMAIGLEDAIIKGTGKDQPIGMVKNLAGAVVDGVYPDKAAVAITDLKPVTLGTQIMSKLTNDGKRAVTDVLLIVNPLDYWEKIFGATTVLTASGTYVYGVLPIPGDFVQSVSVPRGRMVAGVASDYFMGVGSTQKIVYSDELRLLEDERVYVTKLYANGKPKDNNSFLLFDISNLEAEIPTP